MNIWVCTFSNATLNMDPKVELTPGNDTCYFCYKRCQFRGNPLNLGKSAQEIYDSCCRHIRSENLGDNFFTWSDPAPLPFCNKCLSAVQNLSQLNEKLDTLQKQIDNFVASFTIEFLGLRQKAKNNEFSSESNDEFPQSKHCYKGEADIEDEFPINIKRELNSGDFLENFPKNLDYSENEDNYSGYISNEDVLVTEVEIKPDVTKESSNKYSTKYHESKISQRKKFKQIPDTLKILGGRTPQLNMSRIKFDLDGNPIPDVDPVPRRKAALKAASAFSSIAEALEEDEESGSSRSTELDESVIEDVRKVGSHNSLLSLEDLEREKRKKLQLKHDEKKYLCVLCPKAYKYRKHFTEHKKTHTTKKQGKIRKWKRGKHMTVRQGNATTKDPKQSLFKCGKCFKEFRSNGGLLYHSKSHESVCHTLELKCEKCNKIFKNSVTYQSHVLLHLRGSNFVCTLCGKIYKSKSGLKDHENTHKTDGSYTCETCGKDYFTSARLKKHYIVHTDERPYGPCKICNSSFRSQSNFNAHIRTHEEPGKSKLECSICHKYYSSKSSLNKHMFRHGPEKTFECPTCLKKFATKGGLHTHSVYHTNEKSFLCDNCGKSFYTKTRLNIHNRIHTGDLIPCEFCDKKFQTTTHLKQHYKSHDNKKKHEIKVGSGIGLEAVDNPVTKDLQKMSFEVVLLQCSTCGLGFHSENSLSVHIFQNHMVK